MSSSPRTCSATSSPTRPASSAVRSACSPRRASAPRWLFSSPSTAPIRRLRGRTSPTRWPRSSRPPCFWSTWGSTPRAEPCGRAVDRALADGVVTEDLAIAQGERPLFDLRGRGLHRRAYLGTPRSGGSYPQKRGCNRKGCNPFFRAGHEAHPARTATPRPGSRFISRPRIARVPPGRPP